MGIFSTALPAAERAKTQAPDLHGLSFYEEHPKGQIELEEFERLAVNRLFVLKGIEELRASNASEDQLRKRTEELLKKHLGITMARPAGSAASAVAEAVAEARRTDLISHYILRVVYCRTEDLRRWLLEQETALFRRRFARLDAIAKASFLAVHGMPYETVDRGSFDRLREDLRAVADKVAVVSASPVGEGGVKKVRLTAEQEAIERGAHGDFYKVPFTVVPELVRSRSALVRGGWAYVHVSSVSGVVAQHFRAQLSRALAVMGSKWVLSARAREADRLAPIVEGLSQRYLGVQYDSREARAGGGVRAKDVAALAQRAFPLCMASAYQHAHREHHLKHNGRLQLSLFLKGAGMPLEECVAFFRAEFAAKAPGDKFDKTYAYNLRHSYGKEGKRADYKPWNCLKIISMVPGHGECHGCPYRTHDEASLRAALGRLNVNATKIEEAVQKAKDGHYQIACGKHFEGVHGVDVGGIRHPNEFFDQAWALDHPDEADDPPANAAAPSTPAAAVPPQAIAAGGAVTPQT
ncbi:unnamed protein product [Pedinophyceae sp. YPF-701]|nr:unnamed protein product [Pedinophyceae sp. YPF-701]